MSWTVTAGFSTFLVSTRTLDPTHPPVIAISRSVELASHDWEPLRNAVQGAIDRGQIGRPAALRVTVHAAGGPTDQRDMASALRSLAESWFGGQCESEYSIGNEGKPEVTALKWDGGQSAMIAVSAGSGRTGGNLMLMGSNGTIYHEIDLGDEGDG